MSIEEHWGNVNKVNKARANQKKRSFFWSSCFFRSSIEKEISSNNIIYPFHHSIFFSIFIKMENFSLYYLSK